MNSRATIMHAKVNGSEYGRESVLTLTLDLKLPTPVETKALHEWAASELDWSTRQEVARAQKQRRETKNPTKLSKAALKAQAAAHEQETECGVLSCESCYEQPAEEQFTCLAHRLPWLECGECDEESGVFLDDEDVARLQGQYQSYVSEQRQANSEALTAAQEAALFLMLIRKPVHVSIAPAQQAFAELLRLSVPA